MNDITEKKSCKNCEYFFQHFGWSANRFITVECGHCLKHNINKRDRARFPLYHGCEDWQPKEKEIATRKESLKELLTDMAKRIDDIALMLDSDFLNS